MIDNDRIRHNANVFPIAAVGIACFCLTLALETGCKRRTPAGGNLADAYSQRVTQLQIAATSDLKLALDRIMVDFRNTHPGILVKATYGAPGELSDQITTKGPFDIFLSNDADIPQNLQAQGLAGKGGFFHYARGSPALWVPNASALDLGKSQLTALIDPDVKKIFIADPDKDPCGTAAIAAMKGANIYEAVKDRLILSANVTEAGKAAMADSGSIAFVSESEALDPVMREAGRSWVVPSGISPPMDQCGVILLRTSDMESAQAFRKFLMGPDATSILSEYGYSTP